MKNITVLFANNFRIFFTTKHSIGVHWRLTDVAGFQSTSHTTVPCASPSALCAVPARRNWRPPHWRTVHRTCTSTLGGRCLGHRASCPRPCPAASSVVGLRFPRPTLACHPVLTTGHPKLVPSLPPPDLPPRAHNPQVHHR